MRRTAEGKRGGLVLIGLLVAVALGSYLATMAFGSGSTGAIARIHDGDGGVREVVLSQSGSYRVETSWGTNVVEVSDGAVAVVEADCPNADCVDQGKVSDGSRQIVCLPHHLWIEVVDGSSDAASADDLDAVGR